MSVVDDLLKELKSFTDEHLQAIGMHRTSKGEILSNAYGNIDSLKRLGVKIDSTLSHESK